MKRSPRTAPKASPLSARVHQILDRNTKLLVVAKGHALRDEFGEARTAAGAINRLRPRHRQRFSTHRVENPGCPATAYQVRCGKGRAMADNAPSTQILLYQTGDQRTRIEVRLENETVWLSLNQMAEPFQRDKSVISRHIRNIFEEGELTQEGTVAKYATAQREGDREVTRSIEAFNLDVIISVGYRVKSHRGTQFRIWATQRLREYLIKGFTLDDERLKQAGGGNYFDELLARIRDIRSSAKVFWRKVLDIYATSIDYDPSAEASERFFATVQNKMHWAAQGHTASPDSAGAYTRKRNSITRFTGCHLSP
jgi:hypothetical protein